MRLALGGGGAGGEGGGAGGAGGTGGTGGGDVINSRAQISKPLPATEPSLYQAMTSPAAIATSDGPVLPLYCVPAIVT